MVKKSIKEKIDEELTWRHHINQVIIFDIQIKCCGPGSSKDSQVSLKIKPNFKHGFLIKEHIT